MKYESQSVYRPTGESQDISFTSTSSQSAVLRGGVYSLSADQVCHILLGENPTALTTSMRIPAETLLYIKAQEGEKLAVIRDTTDGTLNLTLQQ